MSNTVDTMAREFVSGNRKLSHPSVEIRYPLGSGTEYLLHGNRICRKGDAGNALHFDWCGWYTPTTANHINAILKAAGREIRVSYAQARKAKTREFLA